MDNIVIDSIDIKVGMARVEFYGVMIEIPIKDLPDNSKEGDSLGLRLLEVNKNKSLVAELEKKLFG